MNRLIIQYKLREGNSNQVLTKNVPVLVAELAPVGHSNIISEIRFLKRRRMFDADEEDDGGGSDNESNNKRSGLPLESCTPSVVVNGKRYVIGIALRDLIQGPFGLDHGYAQYILNRITRDDGQGFLTALCRHNEQVLASAAENVALARSLLFPKCCVSAIFYDGETRVVDDSSGGGGKELVFIPLSFVPWFILRGPVWMRIRNAASLLVEQVTAVLENMKRVLSDVDYQNQLNLVHCVKQLIQGSFFVAPMQELSGGSSAIPTIEDPCSLECIEDDIGDDEDDVDVSSPPQSPIRRLRSVAEIYIPSSESLSTADLYSKYFAGRVPEIKHVAHSATAQQIMGLVQVMIKHQNPAGLIKCSQLPVAARNFIYNLRRLCPNLLVYVQLEPAAAAAVAAVDNNSPSPRKFTLKKQKTTQMDSTCPSSSPPLSY